MSSVARQPQSVFHPSSVLSSTPVRPGAAVQALNGNNITEYDSPVKGHRIRSQPRRQNSHVLGSNSQSSIHPESVVVPSTNSKTMKTSPLANIGDVMRRTLGEPSPGKAHRKIVHSPPNVAGSSRNVTDKSPVVKQRAPTLTNAIGSLNLNNLVNKSPILREKFMKIHKEREETSPNKAGDGEWIVQSPDKIPDFDDQKGYVTNVASSSRFGKRQELKFGDVEFTERQTSPVRYRNEIDTSDLSEVSPTKRRRTDSPDKRRRKPVDATPSASFRPITPPNQWARVRFASPENTASVIRKISPVKRPVKPSESDVFLSHLLSNRIPNAVTSTRNDVQKSESDNRRPKLMNRSGELYSMPKSPKEEHERIKPKPAAAPVAVKKAGLSSEDFLKSFVRSSRAVVEDPASESSARSEMRSQSTASQSSSRSRAAQKSASSAVMDKRRAQPAHGQGARPKVLPTSNTNPIKASKSVITTKKLAEALAGKIAEQKQRMEARSQDSSQKSDRASATSSVKSSSVKSKPDGAAAASRADQNSYGGARPKTTSSLTKWKRPTHIKPQAATTRNLNQDLAVIQSQLRKPKLDEGFRHHLESLNQVETFEPNLELDSEQPSFQNCLGLSNTDNNISRDTLDDVSSIASLRSIEAESLPISRPAPSGVKIADTSSTAWTKTGQNDPMDSSSTRLLVEKIQEPKVRKTYRNVSPSKKFGSPFFPIEPQPTASKRVDEVVVPKLITKVVVDERKSPRKKQETQSPKKSPQNLDPDSQSSRTSKKKSPKVSDKARTLQVTGTAVTKKPSASLASPMKRHDPKSSKREKRTDVKTSRISEAESVASLRSSLRSELSSLLKSSDPLRPEEIARALAIARSLEQRSETSRPNNAERHRSENGLSLASESDDLPPPRLQRSGTYEILNEAQWGDLDTVPSCEGNTSRRNTDVSDADPPSVAFSEPLVRQRSPPRESFTSTQSVADLNTHRTRGEVYDTPRSTRSMADLDTIRAARIRALDRPTRHTEPTSASSDIHTPRSVRSDVTAARSKPLVNGTPRSRAEARDSLHTKANSTPSSASEKRRVEDKNATALAKTVELRSQVTPRLTQEGILESQKMDLRASLRGVKQKLESIRADLQMVPRNDPDKMDSESETSRMKPEKFDMDLESTPRSLSLASESVRSYQDSRSQKSTPRSESILSLRSGSSSLGASQRLGEIEETIRRRQEDKEQVSVLHAHENHLIWLAARCQNEMRLIKSVRKGHLPYTEYAKQMVDILAENLENLHILKSKVLSIPKQ